MKVILLKDVAKVGAHGTVQDVANGYALNFLIARGLAVQATSEKLAEHRKKQSAEAAELDEREAQWAAQVKKLDGVHITVRAKANPHGRLYKQLPADLIVESIKLEFGIDLPPDAIALNVPIREVGETSTHIKRGRHEGTIKITVIREA